jgi:hypothetical protein
MGILLIVFSFLDDRVPPYLILLTCIGAFTNPAMFIVLAFNPHVKKSTTSIFGMATTLSYIITTIGVGGLCFVYL